MTLPCYPAANLHEISVVRSNAIVYHSALKAYAIIVIHQVISEFS